MRLNCDGKQVMTTTTTDLTEAMLTRAKSEPVANGVILCMHECTKQNQNRRPNTLPECQLIDGNVSVNYLNFEVDQKPTAHFELAVGIDKDVKEQ